MAHDFERVYAENLIIQNGLRSDKTVRQKKHSVRFDAYMMELLSSESALSDKMELLFNQIASTEEPKFIKMHADRKAIHKKDLLLDTYELAVETLYYCYYPARLFATILKVSFKYFKFAKKWGHSATDACPAATKELMQATVDKWTTLSDSAAEFDNHGRVWVAQLEAFQKNSEHGLRVLCRAVGAEGKDDFERAVKDAYTLPDEFREAMKGYIKMHQNMIVIFNSIYRLVRQADFELYELWNKKTFHYRIYDAWIRCSPFSETMRKIGTATKIKNMDSMRATESWNARIFVINDDVANESDWSFIMDREKVITNLKQKFTDLTGDTKLEGDRVVDYSPGEQTRSCVIYTDPDDETKNADDFERPSGAEEHRLMLRRTCGNGSPMGTTSELKETELFIPKSKNGSPRWELDEKETYNVIGPMWTNVKNLYDAMGRVLIKLNRDLDTQSRIMTAKEIQKTVALVHVNAQRISRNVVTRRVIRQPKHENLKQDFYRPTIWTVL